jgi:RNA polymerase sigma-70 factor (ECF subfamily)
MRRRSRRGVTRDLFFRPHLPDLHNAFLRAPPAFPAVAAALRLTGMSTASHGQWHEQWHFVVGLARKMGGGRVDPEDLAQDVFERWLRASPRLLPDTNVRAWMSVVLRNLLIDQLRRRRTAPPSTGDCAFLPANEQERAPWWLELSQDEVTHLLAELPSAQRATFELFELEGKSYDEIARQLAIAKGTVGVHVHRARARLRQLLSDRRAPLAEAC